ncbi:hypothetical protein ANAPC3_01309 [Anaplasma phagocytophilum]|nr:hypothetical protein ANAPC2_00771 [Anaplasma phagocytophilum]SBO33656.1 hypothetical protein ANAPC3_01309 [Anaplasma phagocytophilum]
MFFIRYSREISTRTYTINLQFFALRCIIIGVLSQHNSRNNSPNLSFTMSKLSLDPTQGSHTAENILATAFDIALGVRSTAKQLASTWTGTSNTIWKTGTGAAYATKKASSKSYGTLRGSLGSSTARRMLGTCATAALCLTAPLLGAAAAGAAITCALITICMALLFLVLYTVFSVVSQMLRCASLLLSMVCNLIYDTFSTTKHFLKGKPPMQPTEDQVAGGLDQEKVDSDQKHDVEKTEGKCYSVGSLFKSLAINMVAFLGTVVVAAPILLLSVVLLALLPICLLCVTLHHIYKGNYEDRSNDKGHPGGGKGYYPMQMFSSSSEESLVSVASTVRLPSYSTATATNPGNTDDVASCHSSSGKKPASQPESNLQEVLTEGISQQRQQQRNIS